MTEVIVTKIRSSAPKRRKSASGKRLAGGKSTFRKKPVRGKNPSRKKLMHGKSASHKNLARRRLYTVDSTSATFDSDLVRVFESNVAAARQANTVAFGSPDGPATPKR